MGGVNAYWKPWKKLQLQDNNDLPNSACGPPQRAAVFLRYRGDDALQYSAMFTLKHLHTHFEVQQKERIHLTRPSLREGSNLFEMPFYWFFFHVSLTKSKREASHHRHFLSAVYLPARPLKALRPPRQCRRWPDKSPHFCITAPALLIIS